MPPTRAPFIMQAVIVLAVVGQSSPNLGTVYGNLGS